MPCLRNFGFFSLLYVMDLATIVSVQLGPTHPSPNTPQLMLSILKIARWISKIICQYLTADVSQWLRTCYLPSHIHNHTYVPCSLYTCPEYMIQLAKTVTYDNPIQAMTQIFRIHESKADSDSGQCFLL